MISRFVKLISLSGAIALAGQIHAADCAAPAANIAIPSGATATTAQMVEAQKAVLAHKTSAEQYLECLKKTEQEQAGTLTEKEQTDMVARYNKVVDEMHALGESFNKELRAYKAANSGG